MAAPESIKRGAIDKANTQTLGFVAAAAFISVFCLVASQTLWSSNLYLSKVIGLKQKAHTQLQANIKATNSLADAYQKFSTQDPNVIGGKVNGTGDHDGDNARLVLDALPSTYDFPALTSTMENILTNKNFKVTGISGTDDEVAQQAASAASPAPQPVPIAFSFGVGSAGYTAIQDLIATLQSSIRPIQIDSLSLSGGSDSMDMNISAHTYYQPPKAINITTKAVK
ncbi:MAG: uncharacterized protein JWO41_47 [Candidatus Saccharibacteria bacterium]|nr:uncharacterized protein [Candidatus Saccharibacteria bacterium]